MYGPSTMSSSSLTTLDNAIMSAFLLCAVCFLSGQAKPSFSFNLPQIGPFGYLAGQTDPSTVNLKHYTGKRVSHDSIRMVYFHDLTVAVVELGPEKMLLNCELIEIFETNQVFEVLGELQSVARPVEITFPEMFMLMKQCKELADQTYLKNYKKEETKNNTQSSSSGKGIKNPFTLFNGIIPGTKWCGTGDIAADYFDLGEEPDVDACCRSHDLCPVKIRARSKRYNLTNDALYTKSHCKCDDELFKCLKESVSKIAKILGNIYFNLVQVPCVMDTRDDRRNFRGAMNNF